MQSTAKADAKAHAFVPTANATAELDQDPTTSPPTTSHALETAISSAAQAPLHHLYIGASAPSATRTTQKISVGSPEVMSNILAVLKKGNKY